MSNKAKAFLWCLIVSIIFILSAIVGGLICQVVYENQKVETTETKTQMVVVAANTCGNFEPALQAQYINDGTICIIGITYNAVWIDQSGGRHEVPTEYVVIK
jgi:hypothetical protein